MYTYLQRRGCKKENMATYVYIRAGSRTPTHAYVRPGLVYMAGSERRNNIIVMFMGSQLAGSERNAWSCSSGGLGRNMRWNRGLVYRKTVETDFCSSSYGQNRVLLIGRGVAYRKTEETDFSSTPYSRNGGPVHQEGCGVPQNRTPRDTVHLHRRPPPASMGYCSSTVDLLQPPPATVRPRRLPPASTSYCSSMGTCSFILHWLLFNHPSTGYC